ncbi:MAG: isoprenylcysteine carboxylmethyltransferase family protein [Nannocystis sp.]|nr:isoprenylcysteine carboxylmethyltransferase family protein [Nannocystis sp.]
MGRALILLYGIACYLGFLAVFLYLIGFVWGVAVPKAINDGHAGGFASSLLIDLALVALFGVQHSVMARPGFKRMWTAIVPKPAERSTFVLFANLCLVALYCWWRPLPEAVWDLRGELAGDLLLGASAFGWLLVLVSTFVIDHFALFGLKQALYGFLGRELPHARFVVRGPYHLSRHPLMLGFLLAFWATPWMTVGHLLFAAAMTVYIRIALHYEERDLLDVHGADYEEYQRRISMLLPLRLRR